MANANNNCGSAATGATCSFSCRLGYAKVSAQAPTCAAPDGAPVPGMPGELEGQWTPAPACALMIRGYCPQSGPTARAEPTGDGGSAALGAECALQCQGGYVSPSRSVCKEGTLNGAGNGVWVPLPSCIAVTGFSKLSRRRAAL